MSRFRYDPGDRALLPLRTLFVDAEVDAVTGDCWYGVGNVFQEEDGLARHRARVPLLAHAPLLLATLRALLAAFQEVADLAGCPDEAYRLCAHAGELIARAERADPMPPEAGGTEPEEARLALSGGIYCEAFERRGARRPSRRGRRVR